MAPVGGAGFDQGVSCGLSGAWVALGGTGVSPGLGTATLVPLFPREVLLCQLGWDLGGRVGFLWIWECQAGLSLNPNFPVGFGSASLFPLVGPLCPLQGPPADSQGPIFLPIPHQGMQRGPHSHSRQCQGVWLSLGTASSQDHSPGDPRQPPQACAMLEAGWGPPCWGQQDWLRWDLLGSTGLNFLSSLGCASSTSCHWGVSG